MPSNKTFKWIRVIGCSILTGKYKDESADNGSPPPHFMLGQYMALQGILSCSPTFIFCHFMKLILSWLLIAVFLINFLTWRKTSPQKHNDCFQICKIVTHCKNRIAFSSETLMIISTMLVTRTCWEINFLLHAVEIEKLGSKANEKPLIIITEDQNIEKS